MASEGRFAAGNCQEMAIPTLFLPPETGGLPDRRRVAIELLSCRPSRACVRVRVKEIGAHPYHSGATGPCSAARWPCRKGRRASLTPERELWVESAFTYCSYVVARIVSRHR